MNAASIPTADNRLALLAFVNRRIPDMLANRADTYNLGDILGYQVAMKLYTVPGQVFYDASRKLILKGVDGVVFVADSQEARMDANVESLRNLEENLVENGFDLKSIPYVLQFNKRDLGDIISVEDLDADGVGNVPCVVPMPGKGGTKTIMPPRPARYKSFSVAMPLWRNFVTK